MKRGVGANSALNRGRTARPSMGYSAGGVSKLGWLWVAGRERRRGWRLRLESAKETAATARSRRGGGVGWSAHPLESAGIASGERTGRRPGCETRTGHGGIPNKQVWIAWRVRTSDAR